MRTKGTETRTHILETALALFREHGYDGTTMRAVADEAGVSLGNAYYYFKSKQHLIHAYYERSHSEHLAVCEELLEVETGLTERLRSVVRSKIETSEPYHRFATQLFKAAADPESPLSPFSPESMPVRRQATELMERVVTGGDVKVPPALAPELPNLLWLYLMGIILFWIHDVSPGRQRTFRLIDRTVEIVARMIRIAALPPLRPLTKSAVGLMRELRELAAPGTAETA